MPKKTKARPGTWVEREVYESTAFLKLRGFAPQLLILFLAKRIIRTIGKPGKEKRICTNKDSISFTYAEAEKKYGITMSRFYRAIDELFTKGFLTMVYQGGRFKKDKTIYGLSDKWRIWRPGTVMEVRPKDVARGFCRSKKNKIA